MYARVRPTANHRDVPYTVRDVSRLRRAERRARAGDALLAAGRALWWFAFLATLLVLGFAAGYLVPLAIRVTLRT